MPMARRIFLLFSLNFLDALLTIIWVRNGIATEGNLLMAKLLDIGELPFLGAKIAIGTVAAIVLLRWGNLKLAEYGVAVALAIYIGLMGIHLFTGLSALASVDGAASNNIQFSPEQLLIFLI